MRNLLSRANSLTWPQKIGGLVSAAIVASSLIAIPFLKDINSGAKKTYLETETTTAKDSFQKTNPPNLDNTENNFHQSYKEAYQISQGIVQKLYPESVYNPYIVTRIEDNPEYRNYLETITYAAITYGNLNPVWFANQMYRECKQFDPNVIQGKELSSAGAIDVPSSCRLLPLRSALQ